MPERRDHDGAERLSLGPGWVRAVKPVLTRGRTAAWRLRPRRRPGLRILFYHRVADDPDPLAVPPRVFAGHMDVLRAEGYRVLGVVEAVERMAAGEPADGVVALCFDDGYRDIAEHALPELERRGFRASVFVATGVVDGTARYSWYERQPPVLDWAEIAELDRGSAFAFEAHTVTHPNLLALDDAACEREIAGSKASLEARLGRAVHGFCYPAGLYGDRERALVARAGFRAATTCEPGANHPATDPLVLRRIPVDRWDRPVDVRAKIAGGHDRGSVLRAAYRRARFGVSASR